MALKLADPGQALKFFNDKVEFSTGPTELKGLIDKKAPINIIDVRATEDYQKGHIPGAFNLPADKWNTFEGLDKNKNNIVYCYTEVCHLAAKAAVVFARQGFPVIEMDGGMKAWRDSKYEIE
jgi:rhodanese-related sulfurtransferase